MPEENTNVKELICYHCGDLCRDDSVTKDEKLFCCTSCRLVYEILEENNLCKYYDLEKSPGITPAVRSESKYAFLEDELTKKQILDFTDGKTSIVTLNIPQTHCSSCIWLLENLYRLDAGVLHSRVNFLEKKLSIRFSGEKTSLKRISELLDSLGYEPLLNLETIEKKTKSSYNKKLYYRIGIAGFSFGNIMLLSFPEYLGFGKNYDFGFGNIFGYLNILLALPVFLYCANIYFVSAYKGLKNRIINIDFPLYLGIFTLFSRSVYEVLSQTGAGYFDSMTGLVFFLLIGKIFQNKTYDVLNFERSYKSYFPLAVTTIKSGKETTIPLSKLKTGNRILIRNGELIPADSILFRGEASIDYSFVTGEAAPVSKVLGEIVYAGGKQSGSAIELEVMKDISQSYLTQLWNNDTFNKKIEGKINDISNLTGKYFTYAILLIAIFSALYWMPLDSSKALNVFTSILIVACPCAIALSIPFAFGNMMRIFGKNKFYIKNMFVIEKLSKITTVVFDKTGTITQSGNSEVNFAGKKLSDFEFSLIRSVTRQSTHPLSRKIFNMLDGYETLIVSDYKECAGKGITGKVMDNYVMLGSPAFITGETIPVNRNDEHSSRVYLSINGRFKGCFNVINVYRSGLEKLIKTFGKHFDMHVLSGDNDSEKSFLINLFGISSNLFFGQSPEDKLDYIKDLQNRGRRVLMIGDGLNDAGALKQSDVGISISENVSGFSPACDAIMDAENFNRLDDFISLAKSTIIILFASFVISIIYNVIGLSLAFRGLLTPLSAAILMPVSSVSVVLFCVIATNLAAFRKKIKINELEPEN